MISGFPKNFSYEEANERFKNTFEKMFPNEKVSSARIVGKFDELFKLCEKLKNYKELYRYYKHVNKSAPKRASKLVISKGFCKKKTREESYKDAEIYYEEKVVKTMKRI